MDPNHSMLNSMSKEVKIRKGVEANQRRRPQSKTFKIRRMTTMRRHSSSNILCKKDSSFIAQPNMHIHRVEGLL
ncbi:hypothetical protein J1N35_038199 [Gossypium stocksii]|uniref:Uncharacterized protein n=1 Tax=Gossypium stocksii TaxID=47602 RepID=A0A9D3ULY3_9ROSI|nr:hypothetical protein J1N35_038199 [Gossypium stocksii]